MKGNGARSALKIWISEEWGDLLRVLGVRTSSSEKDQADKRSGNGLKTSPYHGNGETVAPGSDLHIPVRITAGEVWL
jgi:hypothetical protein